MFRFGDSEALFALIIVPLLVALFILWLWQRKRALRLFADSSLLQRLAPDVSVARRWVKFSLATLAVALCILALSRPQTGAKLKEVKRKGVQIIIALDVSNSMLAEDLKPNRLENAKRAISALLDKLDGDRIGLIVFAGDAYTQLPLTPDYDAARLFLANINTNMIPTQGTAIAAAIELGMRSFDPNDEKGRTLIVLSDGENHEGDAIAAARSAVEANIRVHTIGLGSPDGAPIPIYGGADYRRNKDGGIVLTKLNEAMLKEVAQAGGGVYVRAASASASLNRIFDEMDKMERKEYGAKVFADYEDWYQYPLGFAVLFLLIEMMVGERRSQFFQKANLLNRNFFK